MSTCFTPFDSSWKAQHFWFWAQTNQKVSLAANSRKPNPLLAETSAPEVDETAQHFQKLFWRFCNVRISTCFIPFNSSWKAQKFYFLVQTNQEVSLAANSRKPNALLPVRWISGIWRPNIQSNQIDVKRTLIELFKSYRMMCSYVEFR